jgi:hypothetical protein
MFFKGRLSMSSLVLIPCSSKKNIINVHGNAQPIAGIQPMRIQLLQFIRQSPHLASRLPNQRGILNNQAQSTQSLHLYNGNFYQITLNHLQAILAGRHQNVHLLIISAFYGIVKLNEDINQYNLEMKDRLSNGPKVYRFWQNNQLWQLLNNYINQNNISFIWSLLPDSQQFPYNRVFNNLWNNIRNTNIQCFHVQVPGAASSTGYRRAEWLREIFTVNPNYLIGQPIFPPNQFNRIPGWIFNYTQC